MSDLTDLFKHELTDIYSGEHLLLEALQALEHESTAPGLAEAFAAHREQTTRHIKRLEDVAAMLGEDIEEERCPGIEGLLEEKRLFARERPVQDILNVFNIGAGQKSERYEITHYEGLIGLAHKLGLGDAMALLQQNLDEEEAALEKLKSLERRMPMPAGTGP